MDKNISPFSIFPPGNSQLSLNSPYPRWVDKIIVSDLRDVHVYLTMQNWKNYFPEEWMEE